MIIQKTFAICWGHIFGEHHCHHQAAVLLVWSVADSSDNSMQQLILALVIEVPRLVRLTW
jgi:hypothetical protein